MLKRIVTLSAIIAVAPLDANFFSDMWDGIKSVATTTVDTTVDLGKKTGNAVVDGYNATINAAIQAGQSVEDAVNTAKNKLMDAAKTAYDQAQSAYNTAKDGAESAFKTAVCGIRQATATSINGILEAAKQTSSVSLKGTQIVTEGTMAISDGFLDQVASNVTVYTLKGSQIASKGVLEGVRQTTNGILTAAEAVSVTALSVHISKLEYQGSLREFASGRFGNVQLDVDLGPLGQQSLSFSLDIRDLPGTVQKVVAAITDKAVMGPFHKVQDLISGSTPTPVTDPATKKALIKQELQDVPAAATVSPDVQKQLDQIQQKVTAMNTQIKTEAQKRDDLLKKYQAQYIPVSFDEFTQKINAMADKSIEDLRKQSFTNQSYDAGFALAQQSQLLGG